MAAYHQSYSKVALDVDLCSESDGMCALIENYLLLASNDPIYNRFSVNGSQQSKLREAEEEKKQLINLY